VARIIEELLGQERVAPLPLDMDIPSPLAVGGKVAEGQFAPIALCRWEPRWWWFVRANRGIGTVAVSRANHQVVLRSGRHDTVHLVCNVTWKDG
jgi:hypothetical protein